MIKMKHIVVKTMALITAASVAITPISSTTVSAQDEEPVRIGSIYELSGAVAAYGQTQSDAIEMAVEEINADGGILNRPVEVVEYDTKSDDTEASALATRMATQDNVSVMIGPATTSQLQAMIPAANEYQVPIIAPSVTNTDITFDENGNVHPYVYRTSWPNSFQGAGIARFGFENLGAEKVAVIYDNSSDYGTGLYENFESAYEGEIVAAETITPQEQDFSAILTNLAAQDFDALVVLSFYETAGPIVRQAREMGMNMPILGSNGFGNEIIFELAGTENMDNIYYASLYPISSDDPFVQKYTDIYGNKPDMFAALAYDTVYMVKAAIEQAGTTDPVAVNDALENLESFEGITGSFVFDENHNPTKSVVNMVEIQEGAEVDSHEVNFSEETAE